MKNSSDESTHVHTSDEEAEDLETDDGDDDEVKTIFEVCPTELEIFRRKGHADISDPTSRS